MRNALTRFCASLWRFNGLRLAPMLNGSRNAVRPFYEFNLFLDLARTNTHKLLYMEGARFIEERYLVQQLVGPGSRVVDVGANIGYYMLMFKHFGAAKITCIEPEPDNLIELRRNVALNNISDVQVIEAAAGVKNGMVKLRCGINGMVDNAGEINVPKIALDSEISEPVDLIKIDVEGYEAQVLFGARRIIETYRPKLFVELHPHMLTSDYSMLDILTFVTKYYDPAFYELPTLTPIEKIHSRYFGGNVVRQFPAELINTKTSETFWMVCVN